MTIAPALTEATDPFCLSAKAAAALLYDAPWSRFAVIGDSLSAGTGDPTPGYAGLGWSDRLAGILRDVRPDLSYLNVAVVGARTPDVLEQQVDRMVDFAPDLLHLPSGANDIVRREPDFAQIERDLRRLYDIGARTGAQLIAFTYGRAYVVPVFPDWNERIRKLNAIVRELAAEYGAALADTWDHPLNDRANLLSEDRIHFSTSGQAVLATEVVKQLAHVLGNSARP
ncbi:SGNH/GDSL hydrolase family protein [Kibdelosporangium phytohabitans]|uniref:SGNH/GDSL hydrolase family protein n=1 Tax=Kibdelosporangium phytohabitans TaxID=860235 RepID=UPI0009FAC9C4|nr:SGNH/GDSL hydrolase family protein [Kibdelosporangium phytohabitans]MBE1464919.1 lysophospholipase L1-like esterase [Kibdelosporangium phytohabitans]